jgi:hypothetical protein
VIPKIAHNTHDRESERNVTVAHREGDKFPRLPATINAECWQVIAYKYWWWWDEWTSVSIPFDMYSTVVTVQCQDHQISPSNNTNDITYNRENSESDEESRIDPILLDYGSEAALGTNCFFDR